jgi:hypothetical protein
MLIWRVGESATLLLEAMHHFGDIGEMPVGSVVRLAHAISTVALPLVLTIASCAAAFLAGRPGAETPPAHAAPSVVVLSASHGPGSGSGGESEAARPVDRFYRVTFADERGFRMWAERVVEFTAALQDLVLERFERRPVIFVQLRVAQGMQPVAYVSAGARGLAAHISGGATVAPQPVMASELPDGLTMLFGDGADADAYERRGGRGA